MNTQQAYDSWAEQYDTNNNRTRDLEAVALRHSLSKISFESCLEIGCGTGKNTAWLAEQAKQITAVDLSEVMLAKAKEKITAPKVQFVQADITGPWAFVHQPYKLVTFSLVLEHINNLEHVFSEAAKAINVYGYVYVGELHPFKQYTGSKARFETEAGLHIVPCFNHHTTDFVLAAKKYDLLLVDINEWFDEEVRSGIPRILTLLFQKNA